MAKQKVLIAVKTYPTISSKYHELVCTAGFREDGSLIWIYPLPLTRQDYERQYPKFQWIELELKKHAHDFRKESYRPAGKIRASGTVPARGNWEARKKIVLSKVYTNLATLLAEAKEKDPTRRTSVAVFKPTEVKDFTWKECEREWGSGKLNLLRQGNLFEKKGATCEPVRKLPYNFYYRFKDSKGSASKLMVQDWEIGSFFWRAFKQTGGDERAACRLVKARFFDKLLSRHELYFFLGTTLEFQAKNAPNPFLIVGVFAPPKMRQLAFAGF
jgi:hypothetical protein